MPKRYTPKLKYQVVRELISTDKSVSELARAYGVHPNTIKKWEKTFDEKGPEVFEEDGVVAEYEKRIAELEQLLGKKEVEIALLKNFSGHNK